LKEEMTKRRLMEEEVAKELKLKEQLVSKEEKVKEQLIGDEVAREGELPATHGLVVFNLPASVTEGELFQMFEPFGTVMGVNVIQKSGSAYAFVFFSTAEEAGVARTEVARWEMEGNVPFSFARAKRPFVFSGHSSLWAVKWRLHLFCLEQQKLPSKQVPKNQEGEGKMKQDDEAKRKAEEEA